MHTIREDFYFLMKKAGERSRKQEFEKNFYGAAIMRFNECKDRKPASQIKQEQAILQKHWGCKPLQYYYYSFYRKDCVLTIEEMKKYLPDYFAYYLFFPRISKDYSIVCEDKGLSYATLKGYNIAQPRMIFRFDFDQFYDEYNGYITSTKVNEIINESKANKIFVKPIMGTGGKGIYVFNKKDTYFYDENNVKLDHAYLLKEVNDGSYIVQEGIFQSDEMSNIYPHSVNTYRMFTECENGKAKLLVSLLRTGSGGKQVDNASSGGLYLKVDPITGVMSDYAYSKNHVKFYEHPDTNFKFKDSKLSNWEEVKEYILIVTQKFRDIKYLGWDVACTDNGPMIIEINHCPDIEIMQDHYGGLRDMLHITNPKEWWYSSKFTIKDL